MKSKRKKFWSGDNRRVTSVLRVKFGPDFESISCNKRLTAIRRNFATAKTFTELVSAGRRGDAVKFFMAKVVGLPQEFVAEARKGPWWQAQEAIAHTLAYDATIMGDYSLPVERIAAIKVPTIVINGGASFPFIRATADAIAKILPHGQRHTLEGQTHNVAPEAIAPVLTKFFL
jgi:pimeloyl-ACP methyl ester carboxylesterase